MYRNAYNGHSMQILLENTPDDDANHVIRHRNAKDGSTFELVDGAQRFAEGYSTRLSRTEVWWDGNKINLPNYPNNQIFGFRFHTYGARNVAQTGLDGLYVTMNRANNAVMVNLGTAIQEEVNRLNFSAIMIRKSGFWQIYPPSWHAYQNPMHRNITVLKEGGVKMPGSDREVQYESEWKKHKIKLVLEVEPDSNDNHKIERKMVNGNEVVLVDGERKWYDPASPIAWKLTKVQAWWDGKPLELRNFPANHFFNFALHQYDLQSLGDNFDPKEPVYENLIGIYPSTDGTSVYIGMARRDPKSKELSYAVLIIQNDGQCEVFPPDYQSFHDDVGQGISVLEGYSKAALKKPVFPVVKPK